MAAEVHDPRIASVHWLYPVAKLGACALVLVLASAWVLPQLGQAGAPSFAGFFVGHVEQMDGDDSEDLLAAVAREYRLER